MSTSKVWKHLVGGERDKGLMMFCFPFKHIQLPKQPGAFRTNAGETGKETNSARHCATLLDWKSRSYLPQLLHITACNMVFGTKMVNKYLLNQ